MDAKHVGILVAGAMPPPDKLKKAMKKDDESESDGEDMDEADGSQGGRAFLEDMFAAQKAGDMAGAYDAFMDAVRVCTAKAKEEGSSSSSGSEKPY